MPIEPPTSTLHDEPALVVEATDALIAARARAAASAPGGESAREVSEATDAWLTTLWRLAAPGLEPHATLWALGGYGRRELSPFSDLDLLIELDDELDDSSEAHAEVERLMRWVRRSRLELRHAVRTPSQLDAALTQDPRTPISLLDARLVHAGERAAPSSTPRAHALGFLRARDEGRAFVSSLIESMARRHAKMGSTTHLLEPHIKNGAGGMRDLHALRWASLVRFGTTPDDLEDAPAWSESCAEHYADALAHLLHARHILHLHHGRKHDRLRFPDQELLAAHRRAPDHASREDVETLMRTHYTLARETLHVSRRALRAWKAPERTALKPRALTTELVQCGLEIGLADASHVPSMHTCLDAIEHACRLDVDLDPELERTLHESSSRWPDDALEDPSIPPRIASMIADPHAPSALSGALLACGALTAAIPEFTPLVCHVHHDTFHVYTTDEHSLRCLELGRAIVSGRPHPALERWPRIGELAKDVDHELLLWACLLHDVGKNRGGSHSRVGADLVPAIASRLHIDEARAERLAFLVLEHLALVLAAKRHDTSSLDVLEPLARLVDDLDTLRTLTLLTFCDASTVHPDGMSQWDVSLIQRLHSSIETILVEDAENHATLERAIDSSARLSSLERARRDELVARLVSLRPRQLALARDPDELVRELEILSDWLEDPEHPLVRSFTPHNQGYVEVLVCAHATHDILSSISGVLSSRGLLILSAHVCFDTRGAFLGAFRLAQHVARPFASLPSPRSPVPEPSRRAEVERLVVDALEGRAHPDELLATRLSESGLRHTRGPRVDVDVRVHRRGRRGALAEVRAPDRLGLFYDLCRTLEEHDARIDFAKFDGHGNRVHDTLYIEPIHTPAFSRAELEMLERALSAAARHNARSDS